MYQGFIYRGAGGQGGSFPPAKNFMFINDVIQKMVSNYNSVTTPIILIKVPPPMYFPPLSNIYR